MLVMKIECKSVGDNNIEGMVLFEADDFDDIKLQKEKMKRKTFIAAFFSPFSF